MKTFEEIYRNLYENEREKWDYYRCFQPPSHPWTLGKIMENKFLFDKLMENDALIRRLDKESPEIDDIIQDEYFYKEVNEDKLSFDEIMKDNEKSIKFIKRYIHYGGKSGTKLLNDINKLEPFRLKHIISTFFLGIYLYHSSDIINTEINNEISKIKQKHNIKSEENANDTFSYMWFLICLFHDLGYQYEDKRQKEKSYNSFKEKYKEYPLKLESVDGIPEFYTNIVEKYFTYRLNECEKNDHGICAAHILFHDLCKIRKENSDSHQPNRQPKYNLAFEKELEHLYNYAAWIILAHNIWYVEKDNKKNVGKDIETNVGKDIEKAKHCELYELYKLHELILDEDKHKIKFKEYPFLFLFCLVDSIEPIKRINPIPLSQVSLEISEDKEEITIRPHLNKYFLEGIQNSTKWVTETKRTPHSIKIDLTND
jgi:hypothetical protein